MQPSTSSVAARVLLVEDDPVVAAVTTGLLEADGAQVHHVSTAEEAFEHLATDEQPDVLLTDLHLPGASGLDLLRGLRTDRDWSTLPILLVTVADAVQVRLTALEDGADDLLTKPVDPVELRSRVRSLARLSRARRQLDVRRRMDAVVEQVSDGVIVLDQTGGIRTANDRARRLLALGAGPIVDLFADVAERFEVVAERDDVPGTERVVELHRPREGAQAELWLTVTVLVVPDDPQRARVAVVHDVTDERIATSLADVVLSSVAHKLRTPLTSIVSAIGILQRVMVDSPYLELVDAMDRNVGRLDQTLVRILDHAALLSTPQHDRSIQLLPATAAEQVLELCPPAARLGTVEVAGPVQLPIVAAATALEEFVANAVANGDPAPTVHVSATDEELALTVRDTGHGFPPEDADHLFTPFFQSDRTGQSPGVGLGLPLVAHVVGRAGGHVEAQSVAGSHTHFEVRFPRRTTPTAEVSAGLTQVAA